MKPATPKRNLRKSSRKARQHFDNIDFYGILCDWVEMGFVK
jgi:hypothetical protein